MSADTPNQTGPAQSAKHSPLYQGMVAVRCTHCEKIHKLIITSDEQDMVEVQVDGLVSALRRAGHRVAAAVLESWHPGTDLNIRDWESIDRLFDELAAGDMPF